jgi:membrane protein
MRHHLRGAFEWVMRRAPNTPAAALINAGRKFQRDDGLLLAGALAYFCALSLAPLLLVLTGVATLVMDDGPVRAHLLAQVERVLGPEGRRVVRTILVRVSAPEGGVTSIVVGSAALLFGATSMFVHLQTALNRVWGVRRRPRHHVIRKRLVSMLMVLCLALLLAASILLTGALTAAHAWVDAHAHLGHSHAHARIDTAWHVLDWSMSLGVIAALLAAIFRTLPDVKLMWRDVWLGAAVTTILFAGGKYAIGLYIGHKSLASAYGAAGSFVVLLAWLYYSSVVLIYGAELTQVLATAAGRHPAPRGDALLDPMSESFLPQRDVLAPVRHGSSGSHRSLVRPPEVAPPKTTAQRRARS